MRHGTPDDRPASEDPMVLPSEAAVKEVVARFAALTPNQRFMALGCLFRPGMVRALAWAAAEGTFDEPNWEQILQDRLQEMLPVAGWAQLDVACRAAVQNEDAPECEAPPPSGGGGVRTTFIYALIEPRPDHPEFGKPRYVGKSDRPKARYSAHFKQDTPHLHKCRWVAAVGRAGLKPGLEILEECPYDGWEYREIYWIRHLQEAGCRLLNMTAGGECGPGGRRKVYEGFRDPAGGIIPPIDDLPQFCREHGLLTEGMRMLYRHRGTLRSHHGFTWAPATTDAGTERSAAEQQPLTVNGVTKPLHVWAEALGIPLGRLKQRIKQGWPVEEATTTPPHARDRPRGYKRTPETCEKLRQAALARPPRPKGRKLSPETREKLQRAAEARAATYEGFVDPEGKAVSPFVGLASFCRHHSLCLQGMHQVYHGIARSHHGWTCSRPEILAHWLERDTVGDAESREKKREAQVRRWNRVWEGFRTPEGDPVPSITNLMAWCKERGLRRECMRDVYYGRQSHHKGWTCPREPPAMGPPVPAAPPAANLATCRARRDTLRQEVAA